MIIDTIKSNLIVHVMSLLFFVCFLLRSDQMEPEKLAKIFHENDCAQNGCHGFILWRRNILNIWSLRKFNFQRISVIFRYCGLNSVSFCEQNTLRCTKHLCGKPDSRSFVISNGNILLLQMEFYISLKIWSFSRRTLIDYLSWFVS